MVRELNILFTTNLNTLCIFDLDGTLVDTAPLVHSILNKMLKSHDMHEIDIDCVKSSMTKTGATLISEVFDGLKCSEQMLKEFRASLEHASGPLGIIYPGVKNLLDKLSLNPNIRMAICTNKPQHLALKTVSSCNLVDYFDTIIGSARGVPLKPNPYNVYKIIRNYKFEFDQVIFFGDSEVDQNTAYSADIDYIYFEHGYGSYDKNIQKEMRRNQRRCTYLKTNFITSSKNC